jgi:hypothetical protein
MPRIECSSLRFESKLLSIFYLQEALYFLFFIVSGWFRLGD